MDMKKTAACLLAAALMVRTIPSVTAEAVTSSKATSSVEAIRRRNKKQTEESVESAKPSEVKISVNVQHQRIENDSIIEVRIISPDRSDKYEISLDGGKRFSDMSAYSVKYVGKPVGEYSVIVRSKSNKELASKAVNVSVGIAALPDKWFINVPRILQNPELPTGCEVTSLAMALQYAGFPATHIELADKWLDKGEYRASDYRKVFVGEPTSAFAYGCFAGVIERCANKYLESRNSSAEVKNITGCAPKQLYRYIANGIPVIIWATGDMKECYYDKQWIDKETGNVITWIRNEHCMVLTGYDFEQKLIYVNDPLKGRTAYPMELFEHRFKQMESQAIVIIPENENDD
ncbi:MAG: C39 family peptidase [Oscillospiraceae bacterium]|nr:C39 family peptidase [Oscillospiraceae bacterium]